MWFDGRKHAYGGNYTSGTGLGPHSQLDTSVPPLLRWGAKHLPSWEWWGALPSWEWWGARSAIRKSAEEESVCRFLRLVVLWVEVSGDAVVMALWQEDRGRCLRNYIPRIERAGGRGGRIWGMCYNAAYVVWPQDGDLSTYRQAWCRETTNKQEKNEAWN